MGRENNRGSKYRFMEGNINVRYQAEDPYLNLSGAILRQAVKDYITAIINNNIHQMEYFEKWFLSEWGQLLSFQQGKYIIMESKKKAVEVQEKIYQAMQKSDGMKHK